MKGILKFNLPEEQEEFRIAIDAMKYSSSIYEITQWFRNKLKYEELTEEQSKILTQARDAIWEILDQYEISNKIF